MQASSGSLRGSPTPPPASPVHPPLIVCLAAVASRVGSRAAVLVLNLGDLELKWRLTAGRTH
jgi:hypothetical protein